MDDLASILERSEADQRTTITNSCLTIFYVHRSSVLLERDEWQKHGPETTKGLEVSVHVFIVKEIHPINNKTSYCFPWTLRIRGCNSWFYHIFIAVS